MDQSALVQRMRKNDLSSLLLACQSVTYPFKVDLDNDCISILCSKQNLMLKADSFWLLAPFSNDLPRSLENAFLIVCRKTIKQERSVELVADCFSNHLLYSLCTVKITSMVKCWTRKLVFVVYKKLLTLRVNHLCQTRVLSVFKITLRKLTAQTKNFQTTGKLHF